MKLPKELRDKSEWVLVGPMGPELPEKFYDCPVMAVDGGANWAAKPNVWIGDSDSYKETPSTAAIMKLPAEKDASDFSLALKLFDQQKRYKFHLWGFSGGRKDHELFVWGEALSFVDQHPECHLVLYGNEGRIETHFLGSGHWRFEHQGLFSLGCMRKIRVKLTGDVKYQIKTESWLPPLSSWGLSNVGSGEIILENEGPAFVHFPADE
ncbi:MAG: hypothetical protein ACJ76H_01450 [Bacteriovoracaceae bacterium]